MSFKERQKPKLQIKLNIICRLLFTVELNITLELYQSRVGITKYQTRQLNLHTFLLSQFWSLMGQDQGAIRVSFWGGLCPWLADCLVSVSSCGLFCMHGVWGRRGRESTCSQVHSGTSYKDTILVTVTTLSSYLNHIGTYSFNLLL